MWPLMTFKVISIKNIRLKKLSFMQSKIRSDFRQKDDLLGYT